MKTILVTGASSGIGYETAKQILQKGDRLLTITRSKDKTERCVREWKEIYPNAIVDSYYGDLSSMRAIYAVCSQIAERYESLDVLINNAGIFLAKHERSVDGWEKTFAVNHMSYFAITAFLLPLIKKSEVARIVNVASRAHIYGALQLDSVIDPKRYFGQRAYGTSKLCNILFTRELARRVQGQATANCLHPGVVRTNFAHDQGGLMGWGFRLLRRFFVSPEAGAKTTIYLAYEESIDGKTGGYYAKERLQESNKASQDDVLAKELWDYSSSLLSQSLEGECIPMLG